MTKLQDIYLKLEEYSNFSQKDNTERFLETAEEIILEGKASSIKKLFKYFDDDSEYSWVLESLSGMIEHYDKKTYVKEFLKNLNILSNNGIHWAVSMAFRIFNAPEYLSLFHQNMHLALKEDLFKLFDLMEKNSPHHKKLIEELRREVE